MTYRDQSAKRHRWFQYGLRTLLLVMLAIGLGTGWWANKAQRQKNAVASILKAGGYVRYGYQYDAAGNLDNNAEPPGPAWLRNSLGIDYLSRVTEVQLIGNSLADTDLQNLESLPDLTKLIVSGPRVSDAEMAHLKHLRRLETLCLSGDETTDAGLAHLKHLHRLETLDLRCPRITDAGLTHLQPLRELKYLKLGCSITDGGMQHLLPLTNLRTLISYGNRGGRIIARIEEPTQVDFTGYPLPLVCEFLSEYHQIKFHIDDAGLEAEEIDREMAVYRTTPPGGIPLNITLDAMLAPLGLDWFVTQDGVVITARGTKRHAGLSKLKAALPRLTDVIVDW